MGVFEGISNIVMGDSIRDDRRSAIRANQQGLNDAQAVGNEFYGGQIDAYGQDASTYGQDLANYREAQGRDLPQMGQFNSELDIASQLDPAVAYRQQQEADIIEQSAAAQGGMFSGGGATAKALQDRSQQVASDEWGKARDSAREERSFGYNDFLNRFKNEQQQDALQMQGYQNLLTQSGGARDNMFGAQGGMANLGMQNATGQGQLEGDIYNNNAQFKQDMTNNVGGVLDDSADIAMNAYSTGMFGGGGGSGASGGVSNPYDKNLGSQYNANTALGS